MNLKYWFNPPRSSGCDHRSPSNCFAAYAKREFDVEVVDDVFAAEDAGSPTWSSTHPWTVVFPGSDNEGSEIDALETVYRY